MNKDSTTANAQTEELQDVRLLRSIRLQNILSFGPTTPELELRALNVLIGPNGSGKSNLLDCIGLLQSAPEKLADTVRTEGSVQQWLWKGTKNPTARVEAVIGQPQRKTELRHWFMFRESASRFELVEERIEAAAITKAGKDKPFLYFGLEEGRPMLNSALSSYEEFDRLRKKKMPYERAMRALRREDINPELSILSQRRDPELYPELTFLGDTYRRIRLYREWTFGRSNPARDWQDTAGPNEYLLPDASNLALMLSRLRGVPEVKQRIKELLNELYEGISSFDVQVFGGRMQAYLEEGNTTIPASRLSDGTLRFLSLLVILLDPTPPPLICLEEPELGLHPDAVLAIGRLIKEASERTQLIVTTHSDILVDVLGANPEDVLVCEKHEGQTEITRLQEPELRGWLQRYSLSQLWTKGKLGGTRW